jgi:hypothetical protein
LDCLNRGDILRALSYFIVSLFIVGCATQQNQTSASDATKTGWQHRRQPADTPSDPFFYAQQSQFWTFLKVPKAILLQQYGPSINAMGFELASFEDPNFGYVIVKPMVFTAEFGHQTSDIPGMSFSTEVELTALVYPKGGRVNPPSTFQDFLLGRNPPGSSLGQLRLDVLCDSEIAVAAGRAKYHEHKFTASFVYDYSTFDPSVQPPADIGMDISAYVFHDAPKPEQLIFELKLKVPGQGTPSLFGSKNLPEILYASNPPEPTAGASQMPVTGNRVYPTRITAYTGSQVKDFALAVGNAPMGRPYVPVPFPPFDNGGIAVPGSENFPSEVVTRMKAIVMAQPVGILVMENHPVEIENGPFNVK